MRFFLDGGTKVWVDDDDSCVQNHVRKDPPLFHLMRGSTSTAFLARCPRTLSPEQRARLKAPEPRLSGLEASQTPERPQPSPRLPKTEIVSLKGSIRVKGGR